jgi:outer membrane protein TolC
MNPTLSIAVKSALALTACAHLTGHAGNSLLRERLQACSPTLKQQAALVAGSQAQIDLTKSRRLPSFSADAGGFYSQGGNTSSPVNVTANMPIFTFGRQEAQEALDQKNKSLDELRLATMTSTLLEQAYELQISLAKLKKDLIVTDNIMQEQVELLDRLQRRRENGMASNAEVTSIEGRISRLKVDYGVLKTEIDNVQANLDTLTCHDEGIEVNVGDLEKMTIAGEIKAVNPKLLELSQEIAVKMQRYKAIELTPLPTLSLEGRAPLHKSTAAETATIGLKFSVEYSNVGRSNKAELAKQSAEIEGAQSAYKAEFDKLTSEQEVLIEKHTYSARYLVPHQKESIKRLEESLQSKLRLFDAGRTSLFELLSNYDELKAAQQQLNDFEAKSAAYKLKALENSGQMLN